MVRYIRASFNPELPDWFLHALNNPQYWQNAKEGLNKHGIDLNNVVITDKNNPNAIPVYYIYNRVYCPGYFGDDSSVMINDRMRKLSSIAKSKLLNESNDILYIDAEASKKAPREHYEDPRTFSKKDSRRTPGKYAGQKYAEGWTGYDGTEHPGKWYSESGRDKSGYRIPNPADLMIKYYTEDTDRLMKRANKIYTDLLELQQDIATYDISFDEDADIYSTDYQNALSSFAYAVRNYKILYKDIAKLLENPESEIFDWQLKPQIDAIRNISSSIADAHKYLARA